MKLKTVLVLSFLFASCTQAPDGWNSRYGRPEFMRINPDQRYGADNDWTKGFNDGCVTAMEGQGAGMWRVNSPKIDGWKITGRNPKNPKEPHPEIKSGKIYSKGWFDGYEHCTYQVDWWVL